MHRILGTNDMLYKMNITTSERCTLCKIEKETLIHLFWECTYSKSLIIELTSLIKDYDVNFYVNCKTFLLGYPSKMFCQYNIVCLETKRYIFLCRRKQVKPFIHGLRRSFKLSSAIMHETHRNEKNKKAWTLVELLSI